MFKSFKAGLAAVLIAGGLQVQAGEGQDWQAVLGTITTMTDAFAAGDVDGIMATYAPEAVVVGVPGSPTRGEAELRAMFAQFVEAGVDFTYGAHEVVIAGDTALHLMKWSVGADSALSVAVLRRQADGGWKMVIDHPFGNGVMAVE